MNYIGQKFGRLTVIDTYRSEKGVIRCRCVCECGNKHDASIDNLKHGNVRSCGCLAHEWSRSGNARRKHSGKGTRLYQIWKSMRERCNTKTASNYGRYGGRGVCICNEWNDFSVFQEWAMENGYSDELTIDRIDTNGNYEPNNCRWVTYYEQSINKRNTVRYEFNGETLSLSEWSKRIGVKMNVLYARLRRGWSIEKTLSTPLLTR